MRLRTDQPAKPLDDGLPEHEEFPVFVESEWMDKICPFSPKEPRYAYYAYVRARLVWCRERGIDSYEYSQRVGWGGLRSRRASSVS